MQTVRKALGLLLITTVALATPAAAETPLLIPGKQSLYQRVLAMPGAKLSASPDTDAVSQAVTPFTAFYVYSREGGALQVGTDRFGGITGWLPEDKTLAWNQGLTVAFRNPAGHGRSLLFRDAQALRDLSKDPAGYQALYDAAESGTLGPDSPVIAMQPRKHVDLRKDFYLVPIRDHEDIYLGSERARLLRVASVPLEEAKAAAPAVTGPAPTPDTPLRAGLVFAIDSTLSMDPYIQRTHEAVMKIYDNLASADLLGDVSFGLVAFRDSPAAAPGLAYRTRTFVNLDEGRNPNSFLAGVNNLEAASVSSQDFFEDPYAGVLKAVETMNWDSHQARYIVLITDAGARRADDPLSGTGLSAERLRKIAQDKGIAVFVLHLLTPAERADHASAAAQYRELGKVPGIGSLYYGVPTGDVQEFGQVLDTLAEQITAQVRATPAAVARATRKTTADNTRLAALQETVAKLGYALRMKYLHREDDGSVPSVFDAWLLDRDFNNPERRTLDVHVLLTRDQLSDLHDVLKQVLTTAEDGLLSPQNFLNELKSLAATVTRDPERLGATTATTAGVGNSLADLGFMGEYIEDLPYTGEVMGLSLADWQEWPAARQIDFLHRLEEKISYYRALHDHTDLWVSLDGGSVDGDSVYAVALEALP